MRIEDAQNSSSVYTVQPAAQETSQQSLQQEIASLQNPPAEDNPAPQRKQNRLLVPAGIVLIVLCFVGLLYLVFGKNAAPPVAKISCSLSDSQKFAADTSMSNQGAENELKQITQQLGTLTQSYQNSSGTDRKNLALQIQNLLKQRAPIFLKVMEENPDAAVGALPTDQDQNIFQSLSDNCLAQQTTINGTLEIMTYALLETPGRITTYDLTTKDKKTIHLHLTQVQKKTLLSGIKVQLKGYLVGTDFLLDGENTSNVTFLSDIEGSIFVQTAHAQITDTTGDQATAVLMGNFQNTSTPTLTKSSIDNIMSQTNSFYQENSFGNMKITSSSYDWQTMPTSQTCDTATILSNAVNTFSPFVNFANYTRIFITGPFGPSCPWGTVSTVGKTTVSTPQGSFPMSVSYVNSNNFDDNYVSNAYGSNLGVSTADFLNCNGQTLSYPLSTCNVIGSGDPFSIMGFDPLKSQGYNTYHFTTPEKMFANWLSSSNYMNNPQPGTYNLYPMETNDQNLKVLEVYTSLYGAISVEFRTPTGYDSNIGNISGADSVMLHIQEFGNGSDLLDPTPSSFNYTSAPLTAGQSYTDSSTGIQLIFVNVGYDPITADSYAQIQVNWTTQTTITTSPAPITDTPGPGPNPTPYCALQGSICGSDPACQGSGGGCVYYTCQSGSCQYDQYLTPSPAPVTDTPGPGPNPTPSCGLQGSICGSDGACQGSGGGCIYYTCQFGSCQYDPYLTPNPTGVVATATPMPTTIQATATPIPLTIQCGAPSQCTGGQSNNPYPCNGTTCCCGNPSCNTSNNTGTCQGQSLSSVTQCDACIINNHVGAGLCTVFAYVPNTCNVNFWSIDPANWDNVVNNYCSSILGNPSCRNTYANTIGDPCCLVCGGTQQTCAYPTATQVPATNTPAPTLPPGSPYPTVNLRLILPSGFPFGGITEVATAIETLINLLFILATLLAIFFLLWGGYTWLGSGGDKQKVESAKRTLTFAIVGLIIVFASFLILSILGTIFGVTFG